MFRPLSRPDGESLGRFFVSLSEATRRCYSPHALNEESAKGICGVLDYSQALRMVAISRDTRVIIAYFILEFEFPQDEQTRYLTYGIELSSQRDCRLAPVVADAYQNRGVGSVLMRRLLKIVRQLARRYLVLFGGTQATNHRAIHFYEKFGFAQAGAFRRYNLDILDMFLGL